MPAPAVGTVSPLDVMRLDRRTADASPTYFGTERRFHDSIEGLVTARLRDLPADHPLHKALTALLASRDLLDVAIGNLLRGKGDLART